MGCRRLVFDEENTHREKFYVRILRRGRGGEFIPGS